ncbi:hypothetical protein HPB47_018495 [Ixodes persulcatus]|uniref:Uncharacterized protein n=1 Tax=Ixodes persulcatus TaxID=34615 RepID=A0AC60QKR9_IXOPE|nr:hypothetical protein HPB47_018495 [Ixodes persulcatus]
MRPLSTEEREGQRHPFQRKEYIVREILYPKHSRDLPAIGPREYGRHITDSIVHEGGEEGLLEVKCPQSKENLTPEGACAYDKFCSGMDLLTKRVERFKKLYSGDSRYLTYQEYLKAAHN